MMRWVFVFFAFLFSSAVSIAGGTEYVGEPIRPVWSHPIDQASFTATAYAAPCGINPVAIRLSTDGRTRCYVHRGWSLEITHVGIILAEAHSGSGRNCKLTLAYSADGTGTTGTDLTDSEFFTDESFDCDGTTDTLDVQGESCTKRVYSPVSGEGTLILAAGAWVHWKVAEGAGGAGACTALDVYTNVYGRWIKN